MKTVFVKLLVILISVGAISASYVKGRADGKLDAELKAVNGLMIAKFGLEEVATMDGDTKYEWLEGVLESGAAVVAGGRLPTSEEVQKVLNDAVEIINEREP